MSADVKKAYTIRKPIQSVGGSYTIPKITSKPPTFGADSWVAKQNEMIKEAFKDTVQKMAATYQTEANRQIEEAQKSVIYDYSELHHLRADNQHLSAENEELNSQLYTLLDQFSTPIFVVLFLHLPITLLMIRITLQVVVVEILLTCDGMAVSQVKMRTLLPAVVCFMHLSRWPEIGRKDYIVKHVSIGIDVENIFLDIYLFEVTVNT